MNRHLLRGCFLSTIIIIRVRDILITLFGLFFGRRDRHTAMVTYSKKHVAVLPAVGSTMLAKEGEKKWYFMEGEKV